MIGPQKSARGIATLIDPGHFLKTAVSGQRVVNLEDRAALCYFDAALLCCKAGGQMAGGDHQEHGLTGKMNLAHGQKRLIVSRG